MRLALIAMAALAFQPVDAGTGPVRVQLFDRELAFNLPAGMVSANHRNNGTNVLVEYVPSGETLGNWTRLVTIQAYRGLGRSRAPSAEIARQAFYPAACRIGPIYHDGGERAVESGLKRSIIANGCASLPAGAYPRALKGAGEQDFILMFRDAETIYTLNYAVRSATFANKTPPLPVQAGEALLRRVFGDVTLALKRS